VRSLTRYSPKPFEANARLQTRFLPIGSCIMSSPDDYLCVFRALSGLAFRDLKRTPRALKFHSKGSASLFMSDVDSSNVELSKDDSSEVELCIKAVSGHLNG
jgi:hypothetical protein